MQLRDSHPGRTCCQVIVEQPCVWAGVSQASEVGEGKWAAIGDGKKSQLTGIVLIILRYGIPID